MGGEGGGMGGMPTSAKNTGSHCVGQAPPRAKERDSEPCTVVAFAGWPRFSRELQEPGKRVVADEAQERERTALLEGDLQGACVGLGNGLDISCCMAGRKVNYGDEAVEKQSRECSAWLWMMWGELRTGAGAHTPHYPPQDWRGALRRAGTSAESQLSRCH